MGIFISMVLGALGGLVASSMGYSPSEAAWWGWMLPFIILSGVISPMLTVRK